MKAVDDLCYKSLPMPKKLSLIAALVWVSMARASADRPVVGYGSSDAVLPAKTQELFYLGFELGMTLTLKHTDITPSLAIEHAWDGSPIGAQKSAEKLLKRGIVALTGFPTSQESLLASKVSLKAGVMGVFLTGRHSDLSTLGPMVVSTVPSMRTDVEEFSRIIQEKYPGKRGLLISNPYNVFSKNQEDLFTEALKTKSREKLDLTVMRVKKDLRVSDADLQAIKMGGFDYLFMTAYPDMSVRFLMQLDSIGVDLPIFANASWTTDDFELIRRLLIRRKAPVYSVAIWIKGSKDAQRFEKEFRKKYGRDPSSEAAHGFDLGIIVATTLNRMKGEATPQSFSKSFYENPCFTGSAGEVCFPKTGGHASRDLHFVQFSQGGFVPISDFRKPTR